MNQMEGHARCFCRVIVAAVILAMYCRLNLISAWFIIPHGHHYNVKLICSFVQKYHYYF